MPLNALYLSCTNFNRKWKYNNLITIECFERINIGIIDLSDHPYRIDGTHGLYTNLKIATIKLKRFSELSINIESEFEKPLFQVIERCL